MGISIHSSGNMMCAPLIAVPGLKVAQEAVAVQEKIAKVAQVASGAANMLEAIAKTQESQAKAEAMLAEAEAIEARAQLQGLKDDLENFVQEIKEKIRTLEKLLTKEGDDVQAEDQLAAGIADKIAGAIEKRSEETEMAVAGFESRRDEIFDEKRGIRV